VGLLFVFERAAGDLNTTHVPRSEEGVHVLTDTEAFSRFAVDDIAKARKFYGDTLGLKTSEEHGLLAVHHAGWTRHARLPEARPRAGDIDDPQVPGRRHRRARSAHDPAHDDDLLDLEAEQTEAIAYADGGEPKLAREGMVLELT
jgi:catechol 2,3-dioxygenase-like lactoylglutathione lyase family enzyme